MKKTIVFSVLTFILILSVIIFGIPFLVRLATFLGEIKSSTKTVEKEDTTPPLPPKLRPLPEATYKEKITIQGFAEPGSIVKIFLNEELEKEVVVETDGSFTTEAISLSLGKNKIKAKAYDQAGNESKDSGIMIIYFDKTPPELEVLSPKDGASFSGEEKEVEITGKTESGASLKINGHLVILDNEGNFSYPLNLSEGENIIQIEAVDKAENKTEKEITVFYTP